MREKSCSLSKRSVHFILLFIFILTIYTPASSQDEMVFNKHHVFWNKNEFTQIFDDKNYGVGIDVIHRRGSNIHTNSPFEIPFRSSVRPWFHWQFGPDARLSFSPISLHTTRPYRAYEEDYWSPSNYELRNTLQFFHHQKQLDGRLMHTWRYRLAFRHRKVENQEDWVNFARFRMRYRIRYMLNAPDFYTQRVLYTAASAEVGLNMGKPVVQNTFNQNRIYVGIGYRFLNAMRVELRYVDRVRSRSNGFEFDHGRGVMIALNIDQITYVGKRYTQPIKYAD